MKPLILLTVVALTCEFAVAQLAEPWRGICKKMEKMQVPQGDRPSNNQKKSLRDCSSEALYYGIGMKKSAVRARLCAYMELDDGNDRIFGGSSMLMTIYANGIGAERNLDLAHKFSCISGFADAEVEARAQALLQMKKNKRQVKNFHLCDYITSGFMSGACAAHQDNKVSDGRRRRLAAITARWGPTQQKLFNRLKKASDHYIRNHTDNEIDLSGTARSAFAIAERIKFEIAFIESLEAADHKKIKKYNQQAYKKVDEELNRIYRDIQSSKDPDFGTVRKKGVKITQRSWLKYRDAWVALTRMKYPELGETSVKAWLTEKRNRVLREVKENML